MTQLTISVDGQLVRQGLQDLGAEIPQIGRRQVWAAADRIVRRMQAYPVTRTPEPVANHPTLGKIYLVTAKGHPYIRTGLLGASWRIISLANGYTVENTAERRGRPYSKYVVGDAYGRAQAWMHKGRWQVFRQVAQEEVAKLPPDVLEEIRIAGKRAHL